jgi:hypothetical protein
MCNIIRRGGFTKEKSGDGIAPCPLPQSAPQERVKTRTRNDTPIFTIFYQLPAFLSPNHTVNREPHGPTNVLERKNFTFSLPKFVFDG